MKNIIVDSYEEMSDLAAAIVKAEMCKDKRNNISITAGASPRGMYVELVKWYRKYKSYAGNTFFYNFDELEPLSGGDGITYQELNKEFYTPAGVEKDQIRRLTYANYKEYDEMIASEGGLDLMVIGLGADGHFCGNLPYATDFLKETYVLEIKKEYPWYEFVAGLLPEGELPSYHVTMGLQSLLKVRHLVLIANGKQKAEAVKTLFESEITTDFPASGLKLHPNLTILLDKDAASLIS